MSKPTISPLLDQILAVGDQASSTTASGLYIPEGAQEKPKTAKVQAVGPRVSGVGVGDTIIYKSYSTTDVKHDGVDYILVREEDVLAKVA